MTRPLDPTAALAAVARVLAVSREYGFLGPGAIEDHVEHAAGFDRVLCRLSTRGGGIGRVLDLGAGGGLPGLVLAALDPARQLWLLDGSVRRCGFLRRAVVELGWEARIEVVEGRAEERAHDEALRGTFDAVVARSFGPPAVLAECAAGFLVAGGWLVVSEPPDGDGSGRWEPAGLARLGFGTAAVVREVFGFATIPLQGPCPEGYPRKVGVPAKRPLF